jgi:hypothetical protein
VFARNCGSRPLSFLGKGVLEAAVKGDQPDTLRRLLDLGLDPDEPIQVGHMEEKTWSSGGPVFQAVVLNRIEPEKRN